MTVERQRFCPVCDRLFNEGEAVLRCTSCGVQHHPACWVRNNGCSTDGPHDAHPSPEAYEPMTRIAVGAAPTPRVGVRPIPGTPPAPRGNGTTRTGNGAAQPDEYVIGRVASAPRVLDPLAAGATAPVQRPRAKSGRYPDLTASASTGLPRVYPGHRLLRYWYVPAAALLAVVVAVAVIWAGGQLLGGDGDRAEAAVTTSPTAVTSATVSETVAATPTVPSRTPTDSTPSSTEVAAPGELGAGVSVVVTGTGDCLNVRTGSGLANDVIACLPDGTEMVVLGGPVEGDGLTWWQVESDSGTGWAAEDYLVVE